MSSHQLPIDCRLEEIATALGPGATVLLQAPPGAGKTTRVPLALLARWGAEARILMIEPRRLAARAAAQRLAAGLGEPVGQRVGYSVRLESRISPATRVEVVTGGIFLRRLQQDPALEGVACVIFDEFHERRSDADLGLALVRQARQLLRSDLRLLVMSATLDLEPLARDLDNAQVINSEGRSHPVDLSHQVPRPGERIEQQVLRGLQEHGLGERASGETVLVFLPGQREIMAVQRALETTAWGGRVDCHPLHGHLTLAAQARAIAPARSGSCKLVLATSIAESSLTIEGVRLVIDSGLSRLNRFDPAKGLDGLVTVPSSQASAEQRRGRAGRLGPGRCLRLWSAAEHHRRPAFDRPELLEVDPLPIALQLAAWGAGLGEDLPWLQAPPLGPLDEARQWLVQCGALEAGGAIRPHGQAMAGLGLHPRLAHMLLLAERHGWLDLGCALAVLISERDPLDPREVGCDLLRRLDWLRQGAGAAGAATGGDDQRERRRPFRQLQSQLHRQVREALAPLNTVSADRAAGPPDQPSESLDLSDDAKAARLVSWAYPERIALARDRAQDRGRFLMRSGRGAFLPAQDPLAGVEALAIAGVDAQGQDARVLLAVPITPALLEDLASSEAIAGQEARWHKASQRVRCERILRLGALVLERSPWPEAEADLVVAAMLDGIAQMGLDALPWCQRSRQLQDRLILAHRFLGPAWPDRRTPQLEMNLSDWLAPHLGGMRSRQDLQTLDLIEALWGDQPWASRQQLDHLLPECLAIPSGRLVRLDYSSGEPVLAVKLQEMFGSTATPTLLQRRLPVVLHLLSPAGRPAAITRDLAGFWENGYGEVRKALRGRYPKHPWPQDPLQGVATALTTARLVRAAPNQP